MSQPGTQHGAGSPSKAIQKLCGLSAPRFFTSNTVLEAPALQRAAWASWASCEARFLGAKAAPPETPQQAGTHSLCPCRVTGENRWPPGKAVTLAL